MGRATNIKAIGRASAIAGSLLISLTVLAPALAQDTPLIGFANLLRTGCAFCLDVEDSVTREVKAKGWELFAVDNNGDANQVVANADVMVTKGVDVLLEFDGGFTNYEVTIEKMQTAGIPTIFIDGPFPNFDLPNIYWMGANNSEAGRILGEYAVKYAAENWDGKIDAVFATFQTTWNAETQKRLVVAMDVISAAHPEWTMDTININDVVLDPEPTQGAAAAFINAHPDSKRLLFIATTNDVHGLAEESALDGLGRAGDGIILSMGADSSAQEAIRAGGDFKMSVAFGPERYGEQLVPLVEKILAGEILPDITRAAAFAVDSGNIDEHYPN